MRPLLKRAALGALAIAALAQAAHARPLTVQDRRDAEAVNRHWNTFPYKAGERDCTWFAVNKALSLAQALPGADVRIAVVTDDRGQLHAVAELVGEDGGKPEILVLDQHHAWVTPRHDLEGFGYRWVAEFAAAEARP